MKFIVEMNEKLHCEFIKFHSKLTECFCTKEGFYGLHCHGNLNDMPEWCPLVEVSDSSTSTKNHDSESNDLANELKSSKS